MVSPVRFRPSPSRKASTKGGDFASLWDLWGDGPRNPPAHLFLPIARQAGLPQPVTGRTLNGFKTDFHWPDLGLVVETDGLRYHRTPGQRARDRVRDQAHAAAGLTPLRFTHEQVRFDPDYVRATLAAVLCSSLSAALSSATSASS